MVTGFVYSVPFTVRDVIPSCFSTVNVYVFLSKYTEILVFPAALIVVALIAARSVSAVSSVNPSYEYSIPFTVIDVVVSTTVKSPSVVPSSLDAVSVAAFAYVPSVNILYMSMKYTVSVFATHTAVNVTFPYIPAASGPSVYVLRKLFSPASVAATVYLTKSYPSFVAFASVTTSSIVYVVVYPAAALPPSKLYVIVYSFGVYVTVTFTSSAGIEATLTTNVSAVYPVSTGLVTLALAPYLTSALYVVYAGSVIVDSSSSYTYSIVSE